jgi:hypothetical protein
MHRCFDQPGFGMCGGSLLRLSGTPAINSGFARRHHPFVYILRPRYLVLGVYFTASAARRARSGRVRCCAVCVLCCAVL